MLHQKPGDNAEDFYSGTGTNVVTLFAKIFPKPEICHNTTILLTVQITPDKRDSEISSLCACDNLRVFKCTTYINLGDFQICVT